MRGLPSTSMYILATLNQTFYIYNMITVHVCNVCGIYYCTGRFTYTYMCYLQFLISVLIKSIRLVILSSPTVLKDVHRVLQISKFWKFTTG